MYRILFAIVALISYIPFRMLYVISDLIFFPLYYVGRYRRKVVRKNLTEAFPDKSPAEIKSIEKKFYHFFIDMTLESCKLLTISDKEMAKRVRYTNIGTVNAILEQGRSISLFLGHYCNWEWIASLGMWLYPGCTHAQVYHRLRNKAMDRLIDKIRSRFGSVNVDMYHTVRFIATETKKDKPLIIGFIADQSPKKREAKDYLHFLNHNVPVLTGTEKLTKHFGFDAMYAAVKRVKRGYYECEITPLCPDPKALPDYQLTELYFGRLEQQICEQPEFYLWSHKRFKHALPQQ